MNTMFKRYFLIVFAFFYLSTTVFAAHVPGEFLVKLKDQRLSMNAKMSLLSVFQAKFGTNAVAQVVPLKTDPSILKVKLNDDRNVLTALSIAKEQLNIEHAEPNYIYQTTESTPNDPDFAKLWGIKNIGQTDDAGQVGIANSDINVLPIWEKGFTGSEEILIAVIDTGVDLDHPDLVDNVYTNPGESGELANNGIDDDGNGFIDDVHGWNFYANTNNADDDNGHGSHCSGTIGASGNNGVGVVGVNWRTKILPIKFLGSGGDGSLAAAVESINYARKMKVRLMSNSWGGGGFSELMQEAIAAAMQDGIIFVAAAGNNTNDNDSKVFFPAGYPLDNIISVAATDNQDKLAEFSNYGANSVHVAAPGVKIYSTYKNGLYKALSGTSMAAPHVSGIATLFMSIHPEWTYNDIKERLIASSDRVSNLKKKIKAKGRVNAFNALMGIVPPNDDPDESKLITVEKLVESTHPYKSNSNLETVIEYPGAKMMRAIFERIEVEKKYDSLRIEKGDGTVIEELSGAYLDYKSEFVSGEKMIIRLKSDSSINRWGFKLVGFQVLLE